MDGAGRHDGRARRKVAGILALLVLATLAACEDEQQDPGTVDAGRATSWSLPTTTESSSASLPDELAADVTEWLAGLQDPGSQPLNCPSESHNTLVQASNSNARGCLRVENGVFTLRVQNLSKVPLTLYAPGSIGTWSVQAGQVFDLPIDKPAFGQSLVYRPDLQAGVTSSLVDILESKGPPAVRWRHCGESLTVECLSAGVVELLPQEVVFRGRAIPVQQVADALDTVLSNRQLVQTWNQQQQGTADGTLTLVER